MIFQLVTRAHDRVFGSLSTLAGDWLMGLVARLAFSSVLLVFFIHSAGTKVGDGFPGIFFAEIGAYAQIVPPIAEGASYDPGQIAFIPWGLMVHLGTYAEFLLPLMILLGLFTRAASAAMIGFIAVMTYVDIQFHGVGPETIGGFFDRFHNAAISDQRLLWVVPLIYLVLNGAGKVSLDTLLVRYRR